MYIRNNLWISIAQVILSLFLFSSLWSANHHPSASVVLPSFSVRDQVHRRLAGRGRVGVPFVPVLGCNFRIWHDIEKLKFGVSALTQLMTQFLVVVLYFQALHTRKLPEIFCLFFYFYFLDIMRERTFKFPLDDQVEPKVQDVTCR